MKHKFYFLIALFICCINSAISFGQIKSDSSELNKKFALGVAIDLPGALGLGFVNLTGDYYVNSRSYARASVSLFGQDGSHYSIQYNYIINRWTNVSLLGRIYGWKDDWIDLYGFGGVYMLNIRNYFNKNEIGSVKWGIRSGTSAIFIMPAVGIGIEGPARLFSLLHIPNVVESAFVSFPPAEVGVGIRYKF